MEKDLPEYAMGPLRRFIAFWEECHQLLHLSMRGISMIQAVPKTVEALEMAYAAGYGGSSDKERLSTSDAKQIAELAKRECDSGFPLLHAQLLVALWGALEAAIEDMLVGMLLNEPEALKNDAFSKIKIPLAEFELLDKDERMRVLVEDIGRGRGTHGVDAFETSLARFDLTGNVEEGDKKTIWEMHHLRNVIVHRSSLADRRLVQSCPWLNLKIGDKVTVTHEALLRYGNALAEYTLAVAYRLATRYSVDLDAKIKRVHEDRLKAPEDQYYEK
jgi:hypothetical protein